MDVSWAKVTRSGTCLFFRGASLFTLRDMLPNDTGRLETEILLLSNPKTEVDRTESFFRRADHSIWNSPSHMCLSRSALLIKYPISSSSRCADSRLAFDPASNLGSIEAWSYDLSNPATLAGGINNDDAQSAW